MLHAGHDQFGGHLPFACGCAACHGLSVLPATTYDMLNTPSPSYGSIPGAPQLQSNPSATVKLYIDFDGADAFSWGGMSVPATPAFDRDGNTSSFSASEVSAMTEIFHRVSEKFSPFNLNVTTIDPGPINDGLKLAMRVIVGGNGAWTGGTYGGIAQSGSFADPYQPNTAFVFPAHLGGGDPKYTAEATAHEAAHGFGLSHQRQYSGSTLINEYHPGDSQRAPIMGNSYFSARGLWWYGTAFPSFMQDDLFILSHSSNGFGYRADDHGNSAGAATALSVSGGSISAAGILHQTSDVDVFSFTTTGGTVSVNAAVAQHGAMLDLRLQLWDSAGNVLSSVDTASLGESLSHSVSAGSYRIAVLSKGNYGDIGQYTLSGTIPSGASAPVANPGAGYSAPEGGSVSLSGSASTGSGLTYAWDLDGDGIFGETGPNASRGAETGANVAFSAAGLDGPSSYNVSLRVTDGGGQSATASTSISITNVAPTLTISGATSVNEGSVYTLNLSRTDPGADTIASWLIAWGDGTSTTVNGNPSSVSKTYADNGNYTITASATDEDGTYNANSKAVTVANVAPTLTISGASSVNEGSVYTLNLSRTDPGADTISHWVITWGDGTVQTVSGNPSSVSKTYADNGTYTITASATDEDGTHNANSKAVAVANVAPTLTISGASSVNQGAVYTLNLSRTDPGADTIASWLIAWGDGTSTTVSGNPSSVSKTYASAGAFSITASATDEDGTHNANALALNVVASSINAEAGGPYAAPEGGSVGLSGSASTGSSLAYAWDLDGDGIFGETGPNATRGAETGVNVAFSAAGLDGPSSYTVSLRVTDSFGQTRTDAATVNIANVAPTLTISGATSVNEGSVYTLNLSRTDPGADTIASWLIAWGDGTSTTVSGNPSSVSKTYADNGAYTITASATDEDGTYNANTKAVAVANVAPTLTLSGASSVNEGSVYTLNLSRTDPGADTIASWLIVWGDGTSTTVSGNPSSVSKTYADNGAYTITASATDEDGIYNANSKAVTVANVAPTLTISGAASVNQGAVYTLNLSRTDPGADTIASWLIAWGDGTSTTVNGNPSSVSKTYASAGAFSITASATDEDGTHNANALALNVVASSINAEAGGPYAAPEGGSVSLSGSASTGSGLAYAWDLDGDGIFGETGPNATRGAETGVNVAFSAAGLDGPSSYNVSLRVTDSFGQTRTDAATVNITNVAPTLTISGASSVNEGSAYTLNLSRTDPGADTISHWVITWGDGTVQTVSGNPSSVSKTFADNRSVSITAVAVDEDGVYYSNAHALQVRNVAPTLTVSGEASVDQGATYTLQLSRSDPGADTITSWLIAWGDGTSTTVSGNPSSVSRTMLVAGTFTVTATATDEDGTHSANSVEVTVNDAAPTVGLALPATINEGQTVQVALNYVDPGADVPTRWTLHWSDGFKQVINGSPTHAARAIAEPGVYSVHAVVTDAHGSYETDSTTLVVRNVDPELELRGETVASRDQVYTLNLAAYDPGTLTIFGWVVNWGDGRVSFYEGDATNVTHTFDAAGEYRVHASAIDLFGYYNAASLKISVFAAPEPQAAPMVSPAPAASPAVVPSRSPLVVPAARQGTLFGDSPIRMAQPAARGLDDLLSLAA